MKQHVSIAVGVDSPSQKKKNTERLIHQNIKLNQQIRKLQESMGKLITQNAIQVQDSDHKKNKNKKMQELSTQEGYMKKLKNKLSQLRASYSHSLMKELKRQQNNIVLLKRQYQALQIEKDTLSKVCYKKRQALDQNRPMETLKNKTEEKLSKVRQQNANIGNQIHNLERQVRKYHKQSQMNKSYKDQKIVIQNLQEQLSKLQQEKKSWQRRIKGVQQKWKPQLSNLDKQFLTMKEIVSRKQKIIEQSQKQFRSWQTRASAARNESEVLLDRQRISKVTTNSPRKSFSNKKKEGTTTNILKTTRLEQKRTQRKWNYGDTTQSRQIKSKIDTRNVNEQKQNQFIDSKEIENKIVTNSIGVGTSFYFNDDQN